MAEKNIKKWSGKRDFCDICHRDISDKEFIDGRILTGQWALMCMRCYGALGNGIGTVSGQQYNAKGVKIAG